MPVATPAAAPLADSPQPAPLERAAALLARHGVEWHRGGGKGRPAATETDALATGLMELFRRSGDAAAFDLLVRLSRDRLVRRVRARTRYLGEQIDADELVQDALINIYRYPDRFDARQPGAFKAWSTTIVDNAVRRHLRRSRMGPRVTLRSDEVLSQEPDRRNRGPHDTAMEAEALERVGKAYRLLLAAYLQAFQTLSSRERFVMHMVEVKGMRYAPLAEILEIRPEALKMVVFRARRRILERMRHLLPTASTAAASAAG